MTWTFAVNKDTVISQQKWSGDREQCWRWNGKYTGLLFSPWPWSWKVGV